MGAPTKRIGEVLVAKGLITAQQRDDVLAEQRATGEFFGAILVQKGWITEEVLLETLAEQYGIPAQHLDLEAIDWSIARGFSGSTIAEHRCLPIRINEAAVTVAVANPLETWGPSKIQQAAGGRTVEVVLVPEGELKAAIREYQRAAAKHLGASLQRRNHAHE